MPKKKPAVPNGGAGAVPFPQRLQVARERRQAQARASAELDQGELRTLPLHLIDEPELPARELMDQEAMDELMGSMRELGLISPIVVVVRGERFRCVAGHRRLIAARQLKWQSIRALVHAEGWADELAAMVHENVVREDLNPAQEAVFYAQLMEKYALDEAGLCAAVKRSPDYVAARWGLLRGDEKVFEWLRAGKISFAVARVLNKFPDEVMRRYYLDQALRSGTAARVVEQWFEDWKARQVPGGQSAPVGGPPPAPSDIPPSSIECFLCGGAKDPYNLVTVYIHKWELAEMQRRMATAVVDDSVAEAEAPISTEG